MEVYHSHIWNINNINNKARSYFKDSVILNFQDQPRLIAADICQPDSSQHQRSKPDTL